MMLPLRGRHTHASKIIGCVLLGFLGRVIFDQIVDSEKLTSTGGSHSGIKHVRNCPPCAPGHDCPHCSPRYVQADLPTEIPPPYKPKGMYEITRWIYFDEKNVYDLINEEPHLDLSGHWHEEMKAVSQVGVNYINANKMLGTSWELVRLHDGYLRTDSQRGTDYMLDLIVKPVNINFSKQAPEVMFRVRLVHPYETLQNARQLSVKREIQGKIKVLIPLSSESKNIEDLIGSYAKVVEDKTVELVFVLFTGVTAKERESSTGLLSKLRQASKKHPKVRMKTLVKEGPYHYLKGVQYGCSNAAQPEDIVLALQEDARFTSSFLSHCRAIPEPTKRAYLPVPFKQYNPDVVERGMPPGKPKNVDKKEHSKFTGFWAHTFHEYFCAYQLDVVNALSGPSKIQNTINIYELFLRKQIEPFSGVEPGLFKAYYPEHCEKPVKFETSQVCFRNKIEAMGSKPALGILYITEVIHQKKKHS